MNLGFLSDFMCCGRTRNHSSVRDSPYDAMLMGDGTFDAADMVVTHTSISMADLAGYLLKFGPSKGPQRRWFVLKEDLFYFNHEQDLTPKGVVALNSDLLVPNIWERYEDDLRIIEIQHPACAYLRCENSSEWIKAFQKIRVTTLINGVEENAIDGYDIYDDQVVVMEGSMEKRGFGDRWKRYWFVLRNESLSYYAAREDEKPKGVISLNDDLMNPFLEVSPFMADIGMMRVTYCKTLYLSAPTPEDHAEWLSGIKASVSHKRNSKAWLVKNPTGWKRSGKVREVIVPIVDTLRDPSRVEFFRRFLLEMNCERYLKFWLDVQNYRRLCKKEDASYLRPCAIVIYQKYIKGGSESDVYLPRSLQQLVGDRLADTPTVDVFAECQQVIIQILSDFYYHQYLSSGICSEMASKLVQGLL